MVAIVVRCELTGDDVWCAVILHRASEDPRLSPTWFRPTEDVGGAITLSVHELFSRVLAIEATPRPFAFEYLSLFATDEEEKEKLLELSSVEGYDRLLRKLLHPLHPAANIHYAQCHRLPQCVCSVAGRTSTMSTVTVNADAGGK